MGHYEWFTKFHRSVYRATGGRIGSKLMGLHMLLLTTVGRKTGLERVIPLACFPDGDDLVVVASNDGQAHHPAWWRNLQSNPDARVRFGREERRVRATLARGEERDRLWLRVKRENPRYTEYEKRTTREIPVVILRRVEPGSADVTR